MPKSKHKPAGRAGIESGAAAPSMDGVRQHADALLRAAMECCRQHDRFAKLLGKSPIESEETAVDAACQACEGSLASLVADYERAASSVRPAQDEVWWHKANALWMASREYARRLAGSDSAARRLAHHAPQDLTKLHTEFELQASALLALRHACDDYRRARPDAA